jgi:hypothetical protein
MKAEYISESFSIHLQVYTVSQSRRQQLYTHSRQNLKSYIYYYLFNNPLSSSDYEGESELSNYPQIIFIKQYIHNSYAQ